MTRVAGVSSLDPASVRAIFKAYDVRGTVPDQVDEELARRAGAAFVQVVAATTVVVGHDMRPSSPGLADAFATGAAHAGADVVNIGLASTDGLYFASGHLGHPGAMFTASHNPAQYNGIKLCRAGAPAGRPGVRPRRDPRPGPRRDLRRTRERPGTITHVDVLDEYVAHLLSLAPVAGRRLKVVVDAGNGMAGYTAPAVFDALGSEQAEVVPMYFELDGTFPNHEANPIEPENLVDLQARVVAEGADIGLAFDGDADRCFVVDEQGRAVSPSTLTALIAARELRRVPGANVIHNLITSRAVPEIVARARRHARPDARRALLHQGDDGRDRRGLRRRAQRALLLPRLLAGRLGDAGGPAHAGGPGGHRPPAVRARGRVRAVRRERRDQLHRRRPGRDRGRASRRRTPWTAAPSTTSTA